MNLRTLPLRVAPQAGEALDSWLEATAHRLDTPLAHLLPQLGLPPRRSHDNLAADIPNDWTVLLRPAEAARVAAATGATPEQLAAMTLEHYDHRAVEIDTTTRQVMLKVLWGRGTGSRYCPDCLRENGGRWRLAWRLGWAFACTTHHRLLADLCPQCGRIARQDRHAAHVIPRPGLCAAPKTTEGRRSARERCHAPLADAQSRRLHADHPALHTQLALDEIIASATVATGLYVGNPQSTRGVLADIQSIAIRALHAPSLDHLADLVPADLLDAYADVLLFKPGQSPLANPPRRLGFMAPLSAVTTATAFTAAMHVLAADDVQDAGRRLRLFLDADRGVHGWLSPTNVERWGKGCTPVVRAVRLAAVGPLHRPTDQLRHRTAAPFPGQRTHPDRVAKRHRSVPTLFWPGWSLALQPGTRLMPRIQRATLSAALLFVCSRLEYTDTNRILAEGDRRGIRHGLQQLHNDQHWHGICAALVRLADHLDHHPAPIDYQRRRTLDYTNLLPTSVWERICRSIGILPGRRTRLRHARAFLFERLSAMPADLAPPSFHIDTAAQRSLLAAFVTNLTPDLSAELEAAAQEFLREQGIAEPTTWQPPSELLSGLDLPSHDASPLEIDQLHDLIRRPDTTPGAVAETLGTTIEHVRQLLAEQPAPPPPKTLAQARATGDVRRFARTALPKEEFARLYLDQQLSLRKIADKHGIGIKVVTALGHEYGILTRPPGGTVPIPVDRDWLYDQYVVQQRTFGQIGADLGMSASGVLRRAHQLGIPRRGGGGPSHAAAIAIRAQAETAPPILAKVLTGNGAHQRLQRFVAAVPHHSMHAAARALGYSPSAFVLQINRLERELEGPLFHRGNRKRHMALTPLGERLLAAIHSHR